MGTKRETQERETRKRADRAVQATGGWAGGDAEPPVEVRAQGGFPGDTADRARRAMAGLMAQVEAPVGAVRVRLSTHRDPAVHFPVVAQGNVDLAGRPLRAQVNAATDREAVTALRDRLRYQLERAGGMPQGPGSGHRPPNRRVTPFPRPPRLRQVIRRKPCRLVVLGVDEATWDLECRDYDFHLFIEVGSEQDSVVYRAGPTGYRLAQIHPRLDRLASCTVSLSCYDRAAPQLSTAQAAEWLGMCDVSFLLFRQRGSERGSVVYRRYDGHYGLLCPAGRAAQGSEGTQWR